MNNFVQYANAAQKALRIGVSSAHKEFFQNLPQQNNTKLEFVVGEQTGGAIKSFFKNSGKSTGPYKEFISPLKKNKKNTKKRNNTLKKKKKKKYKFSKKEKK